MSKMFPRTERTMRRVGNQLQEILKTMPSKYVTKKLRKDVNDLANFRSPKTNRQRPKLR